ncbi:hypothetical protein TNCV_1359771 [Trichonephila clavipes]|nr:hypothetical protein TNCV_1359771 [Trichonephila clavipes]
MAPVQIQPEYIPHVPEPVQIPLLPEPPVQISDPPVQIPQSPVQIPHLPVQIPPLQIPDVPEPLVLIPPILELVQIPPELDTLEPTDALDQINSFVFGPPAQELQQLHTVPSIFHGDLISFLDEFERKLAPMKLTMPILNPCVKKSIGFKTIQPMDLSVNSCL